MRVDGECVGAAATIRSAWESTRRGGRCTVDGFLDLGVLVTERVRLDDVGSAFARMERGQGVRSVITFDRG